MVRDTMQAYRNDILSPQLKKNKLAVESKSLMHFSQLTRVELMDYQQLFLMPGIATVGALEPYIQWYQTYFKYNILWLIS